MPLRYYKEKPPKKETESISVTVHRYCPLQDERAMLLQKQREEKSNLQIRTLILWLASLMSFMIGGVLLGTEALQWQGGGLCLMSGCFFLLGHHLHRKIDVLCKSHMNEISQLRAHRYRENQ